MFYPVRVVRTLTQPCVADHEDQGLDAFGVGGRVHQGGRAAGQVAREHRPLAAGLVQDHAEVVDLEEHPGVMFGEPLERLQISRVAMIGQHDIGISPDRVGRRLKDIATGHRLALAQSETKQVTVAVGGAAGMMLHSGATVKGARWPRQLAAHVCRSARHT